MRFLTAIPVYNEERHVEGVLDEVRRYSPEILIPRNSTNKYEYDGKLGVFRLDRALYSPMHYPGDYGFVPGTYSDDGDPLDVLALVDEPSYPSVMIYVRPLGMLEMLDQGA